MWPSDVSFILKDFSWECQYEGIPYIFRQWESIIEQRDLSLDEIFIPYLIENHNNILSFFRNIAITIDNEDVYNLEGSWLDVEEFCNNIGYTFIKLRAMSTLNNM